MNRRVLGRTGLSVSEIGYGAWGIGGTMWIGARDDESLDALRHACDLGLNFIDTALVYGNGRSEKLVGEIVRQRPDTIVVATKVPPRNGLWPARRGVAVHKVFPGPHVTASTETSLRNLGLERIDVLQLHVWQDDFIGAGDWQAALDKLKASGKVRFVGVSINDHDPASALRAVASGIFDTVQVVHNVFDQSPADELYPLCLKHNVGVIVRVPLDEGGLTGTIRPDTVFPPADFRASYFEGDRKRQVFERVQKLETLLGQEAATVPELALRYCLSHDAVSTVIPGMRRRSTVDASCGVSDGRRLSTELMKALRQHAWLRSFYA